MIELVDKNSGVTIYLPTPSPDEDVDISTLPGCIMTPEQIDEYLKFHKKRTRTKMRIINQIRRFRGLDIDLFSIYATEFGGYGFNLLQIAWSYRGGICTMGNNSSLLALRLSKYYNDGGMERRLYASILFVSFKILHVQVIPKKDKCIICDELCETKEFYSDENPYCDMYCQRVAHAPEKTLSNND